MTVLTIGYERFGLPAFIDVLKGEGAATIIDVRALAGSRRAGFSKTILSSSLAEAGIGYVHLKALGTPKLGRDLNRAGDMAGFWAVVESALEEPAAHLALAEAREIAGTRGPICLLCLEHEPERCHRLRVAEMLGLGEIVHLPR
jgi:uncharacterized protein (DUF488 family)